MVMENWLFLGSAIILVVAGTACMKLAEGFWRLIPSILIFFFYGLSFVALSIALKGIEISVAYAVWSGTGVVLISSVGFFYFKESITLFKLTCISLIVIGVVGLNLSGLER
jgi:small multidrug resistance pump